MNMAHHVGGLKCAETIKGECPGECRAWGPGEQSGLGRQSGEPLALELRRRMWNKEKRRLRTNLRQIKSLIFKG